MAEYNRNDINPCGREGVTGMRKRIHVCLRELGTVRLLVSNARLANTRTKIVYKQTLYK